MVGVDDGFAASTLANRFQETDGACFGENAKSDCAKVQLSKTVGHSVVEGIVFFGGIVQNLLFFMWFCFQGVVVSGERIIYFFVLFGPICVFPVFGQDD